VNPMIAWVLPGVTVNILGAGTADACSAASCENAECAKSRSAATTIVRRPANRMVFDEDACQQDQRFCLMPCRQR
jgi:hypothetical protein